MVHLAVPEAMAILRIENAGVRNVGFTDEENRAWGVLVLSARDRVKGWEDVIEGLRELL